MPSCFSVEKQICGLTDALKTVTGERAFFDREARFTSTAVKSVGKTLLAEKIRVLADFFCALLFRMIN